MFIWSFNCYIMWIKLCPLWEKFKTFPFGKISDVCFKFSTGENGKSRGFWIEKKIEFLESLTGKVIVLYHCLMDPFLEQFPIWYVDYEIHFVVSISKNEMIKLSLVWWQGRFCRFLAHLICDLFYWNFSLFLNYFEQPLWISLS